MRSTRGTQSALPARRPKRDSQWGISAGTQLGQNCQACAQQIYLYITIDPRRDDEAGCDRLTPIASFHDSKMRPFLTGLWKSRTHSSGAALSPKETSHRPRLQACRPAPHRNKKAPPLQVGPCTKPWILIYAVGLPDFTSRRTTKPARQTTPAAIAVSPGSGVGAKATPRKTSP